MSPEMLNVDSDVTVFRPGRNRGTTLSKPGKFAKNEKEKYLMPRPAKLIVQQIKIVKLFKFLLIFS
jgi:hypothetical protein